MDLTSKTLRRAATDVETAGEVIKSLGDLAQWIVRDDALERVAVRTANDTLVSPPQIDGCARSPGACLVATVSETGAASILREGYLTPLHWVADREHDGRLPNGLRRVADHVLAQLQLRGYGLQLMLPGQKGPRLPLFSDLDEDMESAFAPLACGLEMLREQVRPGLRTASTGRYVDGAIGAVGHVAAKTQAVLEFPPRSPTKRLTHWFVPAGECVRVARETAARRAARSIRSTPLEVRGFPEVDDFRRQLSALAACSGVEPPATSDFAVLQDHYQWLQSLSASEADDYYHRTLYPQIVRRGFVDGPPPDARPTHFVTVVSSPPLIGLAHELFRFERTLIMYTSPTEAASISENRSDFHQRAEEARRLIDPKRRAGVVVAPIRYRPELAGASLWSSLRCEMENSVLQFIRDVGRGRVMWDMTSGLRIFSHVLEKSFARPGDWMLTINQQWSAQRGNRIPCTETIVAWKHGELIE
ncbi:MAG: hypothetical protein KDA61_10425 [Planctomycetales bacterium]|nr:hypothetical protein [Planctomycetales bacterium]